MNIEYVEQCLIYLIRGIAKRLYGDKQPTPTPARISPYPLPGSGYTTSTSVLIAANPTVEFWRFPDEG